MAECAETAGDLISDSLQRDGGIPGVIGFIDGTHLRLPFRIKCDQDYINRKGYASILLQVGISN